MQIKHMKIRDLVQDITNETMHRDEDGDWNFGPEDGLTAEEVLDRLGLDGEWEFADMELHYRRTLEAAGASPAQWEAEVINALGGGGRAYWTSEVVCRGLDAYRRTGEYGVDAPYVYANFLWEWMLVSAESAEDTELN